MSDARFYHISPTGELTSLPSSSAALAKIDTGGFIWLDYCSPTLEELSALIGPLDLHPLTIEDCIDDNQVPKIEDFPRNTFLLFNTLKYADGNLSIGEVDLIIGANFLVSISRPGNGGSHVLRGVEEIVRRGVESVRRGPAFLLHVILDHVVDQKFDAIEILEENLEAVEESILADSTDFNPAVIFHMRHDLMAVRKSLFHEREVMVKICRKDCPFIPESAIFYFRDISDHITKFFELTENHRDTVANLTEMYLSMLNLRMTKSANETNTTVRRLTLITTVFMPLTLLSGIMGMSEWSMMTGAQNWRVSYPLFILAMVFLGILNYFLLMLLNRRDRRLK